MNHWIKQLLEGETFWYEMNPTVRQSDFLRYQNTPRVGPSSVSSAGNMNKRMIEFIRRSWPTTKTGAVESDKERSFRHMMNERMRRDKQKKGYSALHGILPFDTKNDKYTIIQTTARKVEELERLKEGIEQKNNKLEASLAAMNGLKNNERTKTIIRIDNPKTGNIDSMLEVLKCLKNLDSNPIMIQSSFTDQQFLAVMDFETEIVAAQVQNAVNRTLQEAELKVQQRRK